MITIGYAICAVIGLMYMYVIIFSKNNENIVFTIKDILKCGKLMLSNISSACRCF
jgi:ACR3 family arsenite efflux pump ArsB